MPEAPSSASVVIPFPPLRARPPAPPPATPSEDGRARLARALAGLRDALDGQEAAVAEWRRALGRLAATTGALGGSLGRYRTVLLRLEGQVTQLQDQARRLERRMAACREQ